MGTPRSDWPSGLPSRGGLQAATDAMSRQYTLTGTMLHVVVAGQALELAYLLGAYGLVAAEPQPGIAAATTAEPARAKRLRSPGAPPARPPAHTPPPTR